MPKAVTAALFIILAATVWADSSGSTVTIRLEGIQNTDGVVYVGLCDADGWETFKCENAILTPDPDGIAHLWSDVRPGTYGVTVLHDANRNGKMDFNFFGAPTEQWGSSNNPPPRMGRSRWDDVKFEVADSPVQLTIKMQ